MTRPTSNARLLARDAFLALALLAVVLKVMIPAGFMPSAESRNGLPFALVLCTGDGAKVVQPGDTLDARHGEKGDQSDKAGHDVPCPFAAQGAAAPPPTVVATIAIDLVAYAAPVIPPARTLAPGRGLAAPPPPATGPPLVLI
ncbi:DUF2946 family protein [Caulobacter vibrioides]|uniref:DUF2946 domain-containing protein n=2 Tax=Caulobacter vibrioides TaxID=155892 RepID=Q9A2Q7_CAUVC|nr:DUF2946 family protein [Caulobacter vibrioides]YP_002518987.1 hypothetical protein CCNA_03614 [Caulobacter vibrioides NA1000]AAK25461.1 hypothetical protein CC_3499 [Caulobacter vibrioides CB15]ACL97079.1 hypothetical protein CCNA_03614 [Caulobacter vibrioides NA1000]ATC30314.1 hypothetical protein CA607_18775 [Caulobacter vibrioides]QXZ51842.1 hypothetical protein KZH45_18510 [Caulobacter vibrioides]